jgi:hypothetical protein
MLTCRLPTGHRFGESPRTKTDAEESSQPDSRRALLPGTDPGIQSRHCRNGRGLQQWGGGLETKKLFHRYRSAEDSLKPG